MLTSNPSSIERSQQQVYYSQGDKVAGKGRRTVGKVFNTLANLCWLVTSILGIVGAGLILGTGANRSTAGILFLIGFCFFFVGAIFKLVYDILTTPTRYNRQIAIPHYISDVLFLIAGILLIIGASLYISNSETITSTGAIRNNTRLAGCILFIIGFSFFLFGALTRWFGAESTSINYIKQGSPFGDTIRAWLKVISTGLFIFCSTLLLIGAVMYTFWPRGRHRNLEEFGAVLWLIGWSLMLPALILNMFELSPLFAREKDQTIVQQTQLTTMPPTVSVA